ncbi:formate dehydrogenase family accessory protein FdhD [Niastella koreensis]|uniref:Sulfur carrier protein FdhD n=2 Tax=Niastella koreensis TaxID=354356 RepID=G8TAE4_NIAKG|nr:formate dehydrogenase accessory sulfurtransferase FdhD [Niastella koreensis]AEV97091.1 Protein fdhD [Niastella koreensis GR20-10]OQP39221.1 formate dehydrogenase family accessory protein FdhD [Niastella koreensis]
MQPSVAHIIIKKINAGEQTEVEDELAVEEPLEIQLGWQGPAGFTQKNISVTMRTPGNDAELAAGFLFTEGIVQHIDQIQHILPQENSVLVMLKPGVIPQLQQAERNFFTTSSCGVCGKTGIDAIKTVPVFTQQRENLTVPHGLFYGLQHTLQQKQVVFESTGGLHAAGLFTLQGECELLREDVGRHNAVDKVIGAALQNGQLPLHQFILLLSGRAGFELIQKAVMAGIQVIAAVGAPSSLAVQLAAEHNITLIGFLRKDRFNVYSGAERVSCE